MVSLETIGEQFGEMGIEPAPAILGRCLDLCTTYRIDDPVEFVEQWMAFSVSHLGGAEPTLDNLGDLERKELMAMASRAAAAASNAAAAGGKSVAARVHAYEGTAPGAAGGATGARVFGRSATNAVGADAGALDDGGDDLMDSYITRTPKANRAQSRLQHQHTGSPQACASPLTGKTVASYAAGQAICTFGSAAIIKRTDWASSATPAHSRSVSIRHHDQLHQPLAVDDKYMFDTLQEKSLTAADRLYDIGHQICVKMQADRDAADKNGAPKSAAQNEDDDDPDATQTALSVFEQLVHPDVAGQQKITCCGRIYCDAEAPLAAGSTWLISTDDRRQRAVRLNLSRVRTCALFAGQTVVVRGTNPRGDTLYVDEVHTERQLQRVTVPQIVGEEPLSVLVAGGPFTMDEDLAYEPLHEMLAYAAGRRPDVLVLMGPFVEAGHRMVVEGELVETYEEFWEKIVAEVMGKMGPDTQVIIVSSSADVNSSAAYPTHPLPVRGHWPNLTLVGDPALLNIGGCVFGMTTTDVLQHLLEGELAHNAGERIKRSVQHLFHQASFYPLDPPQLDVGVDSELAARCAQLRTVPNVLLVPSPVLKCCVRDIGGCLVLNPGRLSDGKARGTFARLVVHRPEKTATTEGGGDVPPLSNYVACQVVKM